MTAKSFTPPPAPPRPSVVCLFLLAVAAVGVSFGKLFDDEEGQQFFEAIVGTLRAAKKRGVVDFKGQVWTYSTQNGVWECRTLLFEVPVHTMVHATFFLLFLSP